MKKRIWIALVLCMIISVIPSFAFATEAEVCEHTWDIFFNWDDDYSCDATRICSSCENEESVECSVEKVLSIEPTCTEDGEYTYTATATFDNEIYVDKNFSIIDAKDHSYKGNECKECGKVLLAKPKATAKTYSLTKVKVSWDKVSNASGYYIYRATSKSGTYKKIKTTTSRSYIDANKTAGKTYYYKVYAYKGNVKSSASAIVSAKPGLSKPAMKSSAAATSSSIKVSWKKVSSASGYYVYRKTSDGSWKKIATIKSGSTLSYKDKNASGVYYYAVKAYTKLDGKTVVSDRAAAIKSRTLKKPTIKVVGVSNEFKNKITWGKVTGATGYEIYYRVGESGSWKKEGEVTGKTSYITKKVNHGKYYYYKVRAVYKKDGTTTKGSFGNIENRMHYYYPNVESYMSSKSNSSCGAVAVGLINNGVGTIRVYSDGARLIDADYSSFDRDLRLCDNDAYLCDYVDIPAGESYVFGFYIEGDRTWYDSRTKVKFRIRYDGMKYWCYVSNKYGFSYYELD